MQTSVLTAPTIGVPGQISNERSRQNAVKRSKINGEASTSIPFGLVVKQGTGDDDIKVPTAATEHLVGILLWGNHYSKTDADHTGQLDSTGVTPGTSVAVLEAGDVLVTTTENVTPASAVRVQMVAESGHAAGTLRTTASTGKTVDISAYAKWLTTTLAGSVAELHVDFGHNALGVAD